MRATSASIGAAVFLRLLERQVMDHEEFERQQHLLDSADAPVPNSGSTSDREEGGSEINANFRVGEGAATNFSSQPSSVLEALEKEGRGPLQINFLTKKSTKKKRPRPSIPEGF